MAEGAFAVNWRRLDEAVDLKTRGARRFVNYEKYLLSEKWQRGRLAVIERSGGQCEWCCGWRIAEIHHLTYERRGDELLSDLVGLCSDCYTWAHTELTPTLAIEHFGRQQRREWRE
jgi:hypothetical protein